MLIAPHSNPSDSGCLNTLTTAYNTLLSSTLNTWSSKQALTADAFVAFVRSVLNTLPSMSSSSTNLNAAIFGEHLVDLVWAVDAGLDEVLANARTTIAACGEQGSEQHQAILGKANKVNQNAEADKATIVSIVQKLLVCVEFAACSKFSNSVNRTLVFSMPISVGNDWILLYWTALDLWSKSILTKGKLERARAYCAFLQFFQCYVC